MLVDRCPQFRRQLGLIGDLLHALLAQRQQNKRIPREASHRVLNLTQNVFQRGCGGGTFPRARQRPGAMRQPRHIDPLIQDVLECVIAEVQRPVLTLIAQQVVNLQPRNLVHPQCGSQPLETALQFRCTVFICQPGIAIETDPVIGSPGDAGLVQHLLNETLRIHAEPRRQERQKHARPRVLFHHERLLAMPVFAAYLFGRKVAHFKFVREQRNAHRNVRVFADLRMLEAFIGKRGFRQSAQIVLQVTDFRPHAAAGFAIHVNSDE